MQHKSLNQGYSTFVTAGAQGHDSTLYFLVQWAMTEALRKKPAGHRLSITGLNCLTHLNSPESLIIGNYYYT
ncbi:UNVERIFIED_CONTAM: hypothetical protein NCL1_62067 [Trichonephila clavipes]